MEIFHECNGCASFLSYYTDKKGNLNYSCALTTPKITSRSIEYKCPCINCLVKMICDSPCEIFTEYCNLSEDKDECR